MQSNFIVMTRDNLIDQGDTIFARILYNYMDNFSYSESSSTFMQVVIWSLIKLGG